MTDNDALDSYDDYLMDNSDLYCHADCECGCPECGEKYDGCEWDVCPICGYKQECGK